MNFQRVCHQSTICARKTQFLPARLQKTRLKIYAPPPYILTPPKRLAQDASEGAPLIFIQRNREFNLENQIEIPFDPALQ
jgi:hypothetical protein